MIDTLSWNSLSYSYNKTNVLSFPDGSVKRGEGVSVIGSSGVGKSTWFQLLSGILAIQEGDVKYNDISLKNMSERQRDRMRSEHLGIVFQNNHFLKDLSVANNLTLPAFAQKSKLNVDLIEDYSAKLNVHHLLNKKPKECSVGELQRLSIVRTLSTSPSFILADEPTSALDDENTHSILDIFSMVMEELQVGVVLVTHDQRVKSHFNNSITFSK